MPQTPVHVVVCSRQARDWRDVGEAICKLAHPAQGLQLETTSSTRPLHIAIVDHSDDEMLALTRQLSMRWPRMVPVAIVQRSGESGTAHEVLAGRTVLDLPGLLRRLVATLRAHVAERAPTSDQGPAGRAGASLFQFELGRAWDATQPMDLPA